MRTSSAQTPGSHAPLRRLRGAAIPVVLLRQRCPHPGRWGWTGRVVAAGGCRERACETALAGGETRITPGAEDPASSGLLRAGARRYCTVLAYLTTRIRSGWWVAAGGVWRLMAAGGWRSAVGDCRLAIVGWRLAVGDCRLAVVGWGTGVPPLHAVRGPTGSGGSPGPVLGGFGPL